MIESELSFANNTAPAFTASAECLRIMVKLVAVVVLVSCLLMLPVMIDTFCGFKLGGGYRFGLKLKVNCFLVPAHLCDIFT